jgi:hypothetical protein
VLEPGKAVTAVQLADEGQQAVPVFVLGSADLES